MDNLGIWRYVHVDNNREIPNDTVVKEFNTELQAQNFIDKQTRYAAKTEI
tara:strand:+ start:703 stop:852 length:150 start_codon:yes stop_codon:yes gene_type:complete